VQVRAQESIGEFHHCIPDVDDCMAGQRTHIDPVCRLSWWENLESTHTIEDDRDTSIVSMFGKCRASVVFGLWGRFDEADGVTARHINPVDIVEGVLGKAEVVVDKFEKKGGDGVGGSHHGLEDWATAFERFWDRELVTDA
jgi:hypothetical protein